MVSFPEDIFKCIFLEENFVSFISIVLRLILTVEWVQLTMQLILVIEIGNTWLTNRAGYKNCQRQMTFTEITVCQLTKKLYFALVSFCYQPR